MGCAGKGCRRVQGATGQICGGQTGPPAPTLMAKGQPLAQVALNSCISSSDGGGWRAEPIAAEALVSQEKKKEKINQ